MKTTGWRLLHRPQKFTQCYEDTSCSHYEHPLGATTRTIAGIAILAWPGLSFTDTPDVVSPFGNRTVGWLKPNGAAIHQRSSCTPYQFSCVATTSIMRGSRRRIPSFGAFLCVSWTSLCAIAQLPGVQDSAVQVMVPCMHFSVSGSQDGRLDMARIGFGKERVLEFSFVSFVPKMCVPLGCSWVL